LSLVYIPQKVYDEIVIDEQISLDETFFVVKEIADKKLYELLSKSLDAGECEAIVLAKEMKLSLIIDEKKGRKIASNLGINIFGFIGLLILNYKNELLTREDTLDVFYKAKEQGFRVGMGLENKFLELIGS
jgi:predicted nucleic acid-binding protein